MQTRLLQTMRSQWCGKNHPQIGLAKNNAPLRRRRWPHCVCSEQERRSGSHQRACLWQTQLLCAGLQAAHMQVPANTGSRCKRQTLHVSGSQAICCAEGTCDMGPAQAGRLLPCIQKRPSPARQACTEQRCARQGRSQQHRRRAQQSRQPGRAARPRRARARATRAVMASSALATGGSATSALGGDS